MDVFGAFICMVGIFTGKTLGGDLSTREICVKSNLHIRCSKSAIDIRKVFYGRKNNVTCITQKGRLQNIDCNSEDVERGIYNKCNDKAECLFNFDDDNFRMDQCVGVSKYLELEFVCGDFKEKTLTICQNTEGKLECDNNKVINVASAFYGRQDKTTCSNYGNIKNWKHNCSNNRALDIISTKCYNESECILTVKDITPDPCPNIHKYLTVKYNCVDRDQPLEYKSETICEHKQGALTCNNNKVIRAVSAIYGRENIQTCPGGNLQNWKNVCVNPKVLDVISNKCNNIPKCALKVNNQEMKFDPCPTFSKYLTVKYQCVDQERHLEPMKINTLTICQLDEDSLTCVDNKVIRIVRAFYGRKDKTTCSKSGNTNNWKNYCSDQKAFDIVSDKCNDYPKCHLNVNEAELKSDPCPNIDKYLTVEYNCVERDQLLESRRKKDITICQDKEHNLACNYNNVIYPVRAFYGRKDNKTCFESGNTEWKYYCSNPKALDIIYTKCFNKSECTLRVTKNEMESDPCPNIHKYLTVEYNCVDRDQLLESVKKNTLTICEDEEDKLICGNNRVIRVSSAFYGRKESTTCSSSNNTDKWKKYCSNPNALDIVSTKCDNNSECVLKNTFKTEPDPCPFSSKYLTVEYTCVDNVSIEYTLTICESDRGIVTCGHNTVIEVVSSFYGRKDNTTCKKTENLKSWTEVCSNPTAHDFVSKKCNNIKECLLKANNNDLGSDPCPTFYKYLEVKYKCVHQLDRLMAPT